MLKFKSVEEVGVIKSVEGQFATVAIPRKSACEGCSMGACKQGEQYMEIVAFNHVNAHPGQKVRITIRPYTYLKGSLLVYGIPALAMVAGAVAGKEVFGRFFETVDPDTASAIFGFCAFIVSFLLIKIWSRKADKKTVPKPVVEEILEEKHEL